MEWPKRARTADWENGVLALDREKQFEVPKLTAEIMERLAGYTLVGFHVKGYPVTDELLAPFAGHKSMVNFGVENGALTDACFPFFSAMPKLRYLLLTGNAGIDGSGLSALQSFRQIINDRLTHGTMWEIVMRLAGILQINPAVERQK